MQGDVLTRQAELSLDNFSNFVFNLVLFAALVASLVLTDWPEGWTGVIFMILVPATRLSRKISVKN